MPSIRFTTALAALALAACSGKAPEQPAQSEAAATPPSSEWVAENPTEPAVPVKLPDTAMTEAPPSEAAK